MSDDKETIAIKETVIQNASLGDALGLTGIGGGLYPTGFPWNQGVPGTAQVENVNTIFRNLRYVLISNMRQILSQAYTEIGLVQTIVDVPVDDALRGGVTLKSNQLDEDQIESVMSALDTFNDIETAGQAGKWNRLFGGAGILILTHQDPTTPFDLDNLDADDEVEFRAVDLWELFGDQQNLEADYEAILVEPHDEYFVYYGQRVHSSRVLLMRGVMAPSFIRPRMRGWGVSVVETLVRSMNQYLKATDLAFEVLDEFKVDIFKIKNLVQTLMSPTGAEAVRRRVQLANFEKNYNNALTMDSEDDWDHKQLSFAGLGDAMEQIRLQVAADMRMPLTKLFGISASGFNSGEDDIEVYNSMVESQVRNKLKPIIMMMVKIRCMELFGFIPDDLKLSFQPLRVMSSEQEENVKTQKFARLVQALQAGVISPVFFKEAANKGDLFDVRLETSDDELATGFEANQTEDDDDIEGEESAEDDTAPTANTKTIRAKKTAEVRRVRTSSERADSTKEEKAHANAAPYTRGELIKRAFKNSAVFDRKSYEASGGERWISDKRLPFFDRQKAKDKKLWDKAEDAAIKSMGEKNVKFTIWFYQKFGGKFH